MEYLAEYGLFLAKAITIVVAIVFAFGGIVASIMRQRRPDKARLEVRHLNKKYEDMEKHLSSALLSDNALRILDKKERKSEKKKAKSEKKQSAEQSSGQKKRIFVLDFEGDIAASAVKSMREEISAILTVATDKDEVLVRLESPGGMVHAYGLAASQLQRIRSANIPLTIAVDKVAASGGYMMACVGNTILAAPFSIIGSIGVVAQIPNVHRLLKKHSVDVELLHAGEYKRTLTVLGENTQKGREKMQEELEETHRLFKEFIAVGRPSLDIESVSTGEAWLAVRAQELGLVDILQTSDDYLMSQRKEAELLSISYKEKKKLSVSGIARSLLRIKEEREQEQSTPLLM